MTDIREQAAAAALKWTYDDNPGLSDDKAIARGITGASRYGFEMGYLAGHAAGVEAGARALTRMVMDESDSSEFSRDLAQKRLARFLAQVGKEPSK